MENQFSFNKVTNIKWPNQSRIELGPNVDFVYLMRKDAKFAMNPIASNISSDNKVNKEDVLQVLLEEYDTYFSSLSDILKWGYASKGNFELHLFDPDVLDLKVREKSVNNPIVSLDPMLSDGVYEFGVSRGYYLRWY